MNVYDVMIVLCIAAAAAAAVIKIVKNKSSCSCGYTKNGLPGETCGNCRKCSFSAGKKKCSVRK